MMSLIQMIIWLLSQWSLKCQGHMITELTKCQFLCFDEEFSHDIMLIHDYIPELSDPVDTQSCDSPVTNVTTHSTII